MKVIKLFKTTYIFLVFEIVLKGLGQTFVSLSHDELRLFVIHSTYFFFYKRLFFIGRRVLLIFSRKSIVAKVKQPEGFGSVLVYSDPNLDVGPCGCMIRLHARFLPPLPSIS